MVPLLQCFLLPAWLWLQALVRIGFWGRGPVSWDMAEVQKASSANNAGALKGCSFPPLLERGLGPPGCSAACAQERSHFAGLSGTSECGKSWSVPVELALQALGSGQ